MHDDVEGLNVINDPKCNKVLNVINSQVANYSNYSSKHRIGKVGGGGGVNQPRGTYSCKYGTKRYYYGIKHRSQISAAALIRVNPAHFLNLTFTNKLLVYGKVTVFFKKSNI